MAGELRARVWAWFGNPVVGVVGTVASIVGVVTGIAFYFAAQERPGLTFWVNPDRGVIVDSQAASVLKVLYGDRELHSDVSLVQFTIWNEGKRPIRGSDVLSRAMIKLSPPHEILAAEIRRTSRDVVGVKFESSQFRNGVLPLSWTILEHNDGAVIQIVYAGAPNLGADFDAVVVGQPAAVRASTQGGFAAPPIHRIAQLVLLCISLVLSFAANGVMIARLRRPATINGPRARRIAFGLMFLAFAIGGIAIVFFGGLPHRH